MATKKEKDVTEPSEKSLEKLVEDLQDKYGEGAIMKLGTAKKVDVDPISTGSFSLDLALGVDGLPKGRIVEIFGPESSGKCISRNSIVFSELGMLPIDQFGSLVIPGFQKKEVLLYAEHSYDKSSHFYNDGKRKTLRVETHQGYVIEGTPNHRIRIIDKDGNYLFRRLDELQKDDRVAIQRGQHCFGKGVDLSGFTYERNKNNFSKKTFAHPHTVTPTLALLLGYLVGDGTTTDRGLNKNNIQFTVGDKEVHTDFTRICQKLFGEKPKITRDKRTQTTVRLAIYNSRARAFLAHAGLGWHAAATKEIPWSILCSPQRIVAAFLSALFESDGTFSSATIEYCTKSAKLAEQLQTVLLNFGITSHRKERVVRDASYFYLYIEGQESKRRFFKEIGFRSKRKHAALKTYLDTHRMPQTNIDVIPNLNSRLNVFFNAFGKKIRPTNRSDWNIVYDYLPAPKGRGCAISYNRLNRILAHFKDGRNLPEYQYFEMLAELNFFFDRIKRVAKSSAHVVDFTMPKHATFFANGFVNHNTTLALNVVAQAQKKGGKAAFIDAEHALDPEYAKKLGVKVSELLISQPDNGEEALNILESLVRSEMIDVVVVDSVAALTPRAEIEGEMGQQNIGLQARLMSQALRKLTAIASRSDTLIIFINQIRMKIGVMFGCFSYDTNVMLADGTKEKIGKLVNQTVPIEVLSYNFENKKVEAKPIIDWHVNGETDSFLQFFIQNHTSNGRRGFSCTPDHKIYTPAGWKTAKELKAGDEISVNINDTTLTPQQEEIIMGSLLSDGHIKKNSEQTACFREEHGPKQSAYVSWLASELGNITSNVVTATKRGTAVLETKHLLRIGDMHGLFYPKQHKIVPEFLVDQITPRMIALWYCGDGSLQTGTSDWKGKTYKRRPRASLYTNAFGDHLESHERINRIFARFDINPTWRKCGEYQTITFSVAESQKFFELIAPFTPQTMEYKLPEDYRGRYHPTTLQHSTQSQLLRPMRIKEIRTRVPYKDGQRISKQRFDISIADNHNYFVDDCLVSNSPETTPGGRALKFYSSVRIDIRRIAQIKKGDDVVGNRTRAKVVKNKVAAPFKIAEFDIMYGKGISYEGDVMTAAMKYGVVTKSAATYSFEGQKLGVGMEKVKEKLKEDKKLLKEIEKKVRLAVEQKEQADL